MNPSERAVEDDLDRAFDDLLRGRPTLGAPTELVAFTEAVREIAAQPTRPSLELAELLAHGRLTDPVPAQPGRPRRRRRTMLIIEGFAAFIAKCAAAGAVTQSAAGVGIALVCVTGAGTAGVLPGPFQDGVATAVEGISPWNLPSSDDDDEATTQSDPVVDTTTTDSLPPVVADEVLVPEVPTGPDVLPVPIEDDSDSDDVEATDDDSDEATEDDDDKHDNFGQWVSDQAHESGANNRRGNGDNEISISDQARASHGPDRTDSSGSSGNRGSSHGDSDSDD